MAPETGRLPLTDALAQEIAAETTEIIGFNVLVTDRDAMVIGSGDTDRVGTLHEASVEVMRTLRPAWHSAAQARRLRGVRPGITLPIVIDDAAVGSVGITGSPDEVRRFGLLVQRHTEILVREAALLRSQLLHERAVAELVRDIAFFDPDVVGADAVDQRAAELGVSLALPHVALVIDVDVDAVATPDTAAAAPDAGSPLRLLHTPARTVREVFADPDDVVAETTAGRFAVLHRTGAAGAELRDRCERLAALMRRRHGRRVRVGVSDPAAGVRALHDAYHDAATALRVGPREPGGVAHIGALRVRQVLAAADHRSRERFADLVLGRARDERDWPALRRTLVGWAESGFNLVRAAKALRIHRNTLIYRLDKITDRTGRPAREPRAALALYLACLTDELDGPAAVAEPGVSAGRGRGR